MFELVAEVVEVESLVGTTREEESGRRMKCSQVEQIPISIKRRLILSSRPFGNMSRSFGVAADVIARQSLVGTTINIGIQKCLHVG